MKNIHESYDVVVCGGGLAGFCAAIAAARHGAKICILQDRPVFGGNSSSEVRVTPHGTACYHAYARETGIISELLIEERATNHEPILENGWTNSVWDLTLYDMAQSTPNLTIRLNTSVTQVEMDGTNNSAFPDAAASFGFIHRPSAHKSPAKIKSIIARVANAEVDLHISASVFIDCTGDGVVADLAGCEWRMGSEGQAEFNEPHAPAQPSRDTMGSSIHFKAKDMGRPVPFKAPDWAVKYENADFFYKQGRPPHDVRGGYWWIEIGVPWDTIHQAEDIRHELTRHTLGVWDWIKNRDPQTIEKAKNFGLDFIGQVPGKRESRRINGHYFMTEHDVQNKTVFPDEIAYGGWFVDLHTPGGLLAKSSEQSALEGYKNSEYAAKSYCGPYGIPLRALIAKDCSNLMMAGRNISVSHAALGTVRVMATTALMGQAVGTAAAISIRQRLDLSELPTLAMGELQQALLRDGCFLPTVKNTDPADVARSAKATASSEALLHGVGPSSRMIDNGMRWWADEQHDMDKADALTQRRGQWIAVATGKGSRLNTVSVCLSNTSSQPQTIQAWLLPVDHIWDYRINPGAPLATATLQIPAGRQQWIPWHVNLADIPGDGATRYLRLDLADNPAVIWHSSRAIEPGQVAAFQMSPSKMRRLHSAATLSFQVDPPQPVYGPANVLTGVTRPHASPNLWRSNSANPLPQWLDLTWNSPRKISTVELTFPGHLLREYHAYPTLYRDPQCPKDYAIEAQIDGRWTTILQVQGNYHRHRRHVLEAPVTSAQLRIVIQSTNGDPSGAIYEVRCYA